MLPKWFVAHLLLFREVHLALLAAGSADEASELTDWLMQKA